MSTSKKTNNVNKSSEVVKVRVVFTQPNKYKVGNEADEVNENDEVVKGAPIYEVRDTTFTTREVTTNLDNTIEVVNQLMDGIYKPIKMAIQMKATSLMLDGQKLNLRGKFSIQVYVDGISIDLNNGCLIDLLSNVQFTFRKSTTFATALYQHLQISKNESPILDSVQERKLSLGMNQSYLLTTTK
jgi:hypothetical protein